MYRNAQISNQLTVTGGLLLAVTFTHCRQRQHSRQPLPQTPLLPSSSSSSRLTARRTLVSVCAVPGQGMLVWASTRSQQAVARARSNILVPLVEFFLSASRSSGDFMCELMSLRHRTILFNLPSCCFRRITTARGILLLEEAECRPSHVPVVPLAVKIAKIFWLDEAQIGEPR